jgi:hypothetical protein
VENDYTREINELAALIESMVEAEGDPKEIADLEAQLHILRALYGRACELEEAGENKPELRQLLALRGYGQWTLDNVYAFVYESATDLPVGKESFLRGIREMNLESILQSG